MLNFDPAAYTAEHLSGTGGELRYRAWYGIPYTEHPAAPDLQILHIFIPEAYFSGGSIGGYTTRTAPIFFPNAVGGYMEAHPCCPSLRHDGSFNTEAAALAHGYVVISAGARGKNTRNNGRYVGKAPAVIADLKAAVRFIRLIAGKICGDPDKIIANGTSAGGAMSALLAASGDSPLYEPYLKEIGAARESDRIFAASCYCPITNLEHSDTAYEWQYGHLSHASPVTEERMALSALLQKAFPEYLNRIAPSGLTLDDDGNGTFAEYIKALILASAEIAAQSGTEIPSASGVNLRTGTVDFPKYCAYITRMKDPCAFDDPELRTYENDLFGSGTGSRRHFTAFGLEHSRCGGERAPDETVFLMNAMNFLKNEHCAQHWRIRHGAADRDTSFAIPALLAECLRDAGKTVDFRLPWGVPHSGDYDLPELFGWIDRIAR
ncbi:MAG: alpha/beta hydrolase [Clostridia bacterium]|nr:alpha/beta hydrolase [Clostridia bacterium]